MHQTNPHRSVCYFPSSGGAGGPGGASAAFVVEPERIATVGGRHVPLHLYTRRRDTFSRSRVVEDGAVLVVVPTSLVLGPSLFGRHHHVILSGGHSGRDFLHRRHVAIAERVRSSGQVL